MGRASYGVTGIKMSKGDEVVGMEILDTEAILTITKEGYGKGQRLMIIGNSKSRKGRD